MKNKICKFEGKVRHTLSGTWLVRSCDSFCLYVFVSALCCCSCIYSCVYWWVGVCVWLGQGQTRDFRRRQESRERTGIYWVNVYFTVNKCPVHRKVQCLGPPSPGFPSVCHTDRTQVLPIDKIREFMHLSATSFYKLLHRSVVEAVVLDLTKALNFINQAWELKAQCPASFRGDTDPTQLTEIAK